MFVGNANVSLLEAYKREDVPAFLIYHPAFLSAQR